jgi:hypothetical protein
MLLNGTGKGEYIRIFAKIADILISFLTVLAYPGFRHTVMYYFSIFHENLMCMWSSIEPIDAFIREINATTVTFWSHCDYRSDLILFLAYKF